MEPIISSRSNRSSSCERILLVVFSLLAVISPLYVNRPVSDPDVDEQQFNFAPWLILLLIFAIALLLYVHRKFTRTSRFSSWERLVGIGFAVLAVTSPLYIRPDTVAELEKESTNQALWLPLLLLVLILAIILSLYLDQSLTRFDPYWIHRIGGSSGGIIIVLVVLAIVLKCKA